MNKRVVVVSHHVSNYPDPVRLGKGERLSVGKGDPDFPGWIRVMDREGRSGWAPEEILERVGENRARVLEDYDATELDVSPGDQLTVCRELAGWLWVCNDKGELGWVPAVATRSVSNFAGPDT